MSWLILESDLGRLRIRAHKADVLLPQFDETPSRGLSPCCIELSTSNYAAPSVNKLIGSK